MISDSRDGVELTGIVTNIERYTLHDGPGIRTTLFLKGCPLSCLWCSNPETQATHPQLSYFQVKCTSCGNCLSECPFGAISGGTDGQPAVVDFNLCQHCGVCTGVCTPAALVMIGKEMTARAAVDVLARDVAFYRNSGGGITLSGGEPMAQPEFSAEILRLCKMRGIHTAIQTCGMASSQDYERVLPSLDLVIFDLKHSDAKIHQQLTGSSNERILENLHLLDTSAANLVVQIPLVPGKNDSPDNFRQMLSIAGQLKNLQGVSLLAYHNLGAAQYRSLGYDYSLQNLPPPPSEYLSAFKEQVRQFGLPLVCFNG